MRGHAAQRTSSRLAVALASRAVRSRASGRWPSNLYPTENGAGSKNRLRTFQVIRATFFSLCDRDPHQAIDDVANSAPSQGISPKARSAWTRSFWSPPRFGGTTPNSSLTRSIIGE
jgi:hypothetical protein